MGGIIDWEKSFFKCTDWAIKWPWGPLGRWDENLFSNGKTQFTSTCRIGHPEYCCCSPLLYGGKSLTFHLLPWCRWIFIQSLRHHTVILRWDIYDPKKKMDLFIHSVALRSLTANGGVYTNWVSWWKLHRNYSESSFKSKICASSGSLTPFEIIH